MPQEERGIRGQAVKIIFSRVKLGPIGGFKSTLQTRDGDSRAN
jgi:hypothetical protein